MEGVAPPQCRAHLDHCDQCREELDRFAATLADFSQASLAWGVARSTTLPRPQPQQAFLPRGFAQAGWALAATAALAITLPLWNYAHRPAAVDVPNAQATLQAAADSDAQIAQDNQLLQSVHVALASNDVSPLQEYRLSAGTRTHGQATSAAESAAGGRQ